MANIHKVLESDLDRARDLRDAPERARMFRHIVEDIAQSEWVSEYEFGEHVCWVIEFIMTCRLDVVNALEQWMSPNVLSLRPQDVQLYTGKVQIFAKIMMTLFDMRHRTG